MNLTTIIVATACSFFVFAEVTIFFLIWTGKIDISRLISEPNGDASMSRFQFLVFTFVIGLSLLLVIVGKSGPPAFPHEIPGGILALLGISGGSYVVSKGIQFSSPEGAKHVPPPTPPADQSKAAGA